MDERLKKAEELLRKAQDLLVDVHPKILSREISKKIEDIGYDIEVFLDGE